jgi:hypothetical protein
MRGRDKGRVLAVGRIVTAAALLLLGTGTQQALRPGISALPSAHAASPDVVISQVYGGGGNSGATLKNDFVELYNAGPADVSLAGWSVQYASATGSSWQVTPLSGTIQSNHYYLVQESQGAGGTVNLPTPDASGTINMSLLAGKVALVTNSTALTCGASNNCVPSATIRDFVGYGSTATSYEGTGPAPTLSNTTADLRNNNLDTDNNANDFTAGTPNPRNSAAATPTTVPTATTTNTAASTDTPLPTATSTDTPLPGLTSTDTPVAATATDTAAPTAPSTTTAASCVLDQPTAKIKHVIFLEFDNTHFMRDIARTGQANVPSDLEQMPHLLNFLEGKGTLLSNHHNQLISHTSDGITASESGLYPSNNGVAMAENSYFQYNNNNQSTVSTSGFNYWTSKTADGSYAFVYQDGSNPPAPWVPNTKAGCNVGAAAMSGFVLENNADIDNVFGAGTAAAAGSNATPWYIGVSVHCAQGAVLCDPSHGGAADVLPNEPGGYSGYNALFGHRQLTTALQATGSLSSTGTLTQTNITDLYGNVIATNGGVVGFPSFNLLPQFALGYTAKLQESGVPVTYAYIITPHRPVLGPSSYRDDQGNGYGVANSGTDYAPGEAGYVQQLHEYDHAFETFFNRLNADAINETNTHFVVTAEEGDHHISEVPTPANCDGVTVACTYPTVSNAGLLATRSGELALNYQGQLVAENPTISPAASQNVRVNNDDAPDFYLANNPAPDDPFTRQIERATATLTATNLLTATQNVLNGTSLPAVENVSQYLADRTEYKLLHTYVSGDPARMATFTSFGQPDYFVQQDNAATCSPAITAGTSNPCEQQVPTFNWNHGDVQPQITTIWLGLVGPGVAVRGLDGPDSTTESIETQASPLAATTTLTGTWSDHVDDRPTMLALLGLQDNIKEDGRVLSEVLTPDALPSGIAANQADYEALARAYKQCNAPLGQFNQQTLLLATQALASGSAADDSAFTAATAQLNSLRAQRDAIAGDGDASTTPPGTAGTMQQILHDAAFSGAAVDHATAQSLISACQDLIAQAATTPTATPTTTSTATNTPAPTVTNTDTPQPTDTATDTPAPTATNTDTATPTATDTDTPVPTDTPTDIPTDTSTAVPTATNTVAPTDTSTTTPTNIPVPTDTTTPVPTDTSTSTALPTNTNTPPPTNTRTAVPTVTSTPVPTKTTTPAPISTRTPVPTKTAIPTRTPVPTKTAIPTRTPTNTPVPTKTSTPRPTNTPVTGAASQTNLMSVKPNNITCGQQLTFQADVHPGPGQPANPQPSGGTFTFNVYSGGTFSGGTFSGGTLVATYGPSAPIDNHQQASVTTAVRLPNGTYNVTATYSGDARFAPSTSGNKQQFTMSRGC